MLLKGNVNSKRTQTLICQYAKLLNKGVDAASILVIVQNSNKKTKFIEETKKFLKIDSLTKFNVHTFFGLSYNFILDYWPIVENEIKDTKNTIIEPNLSGLEASEKILKECIEETQFKGYNSKVNLLHQILRRNSLITLNILDDKDVEKRAWTLKESFSSDVKKAINLYKYKTLNLRAFDYLRQTNLFTHIYKNIKNPYKYVILDDADEITPACFEYLKHIKDSIIEFYIGYDENGTSRKGFLSAATFDFEEFLNETAQNLDETYCHNQNADKIFNAIKNGETCKIPNAEFESFVKENEMIESVVSKINNLLNGQDSNMQNTNRQGFNEQNSKINPSDIVIITPNINEYLKFALKKIKVPITYLSGSEKLNQNKTVRALLQTLKLINKNTRGEILSMYDFKSILLEVLNLELNLALKIALDFECDPMEYDIFKTLNKFSSNNKIKSFLEISKAIKELPLSHQLYELSLKYVKTVPEKRNDIQKTNQLLKQLRDFENIFKGKTSDNNLKIELLSQIENTIIAENPPKYQDIDKNSIIVSTAQKIIDLSIPSKHLFLLDTTSSNWTIQDMGPLYNAWVFQKSWNKKQYELSDNINLTLDKTARCLRKLYLLNNLPHTHNKKTCPPYEAGHIYFYSSIYDFLGAENFRGINHFFEFECKQKSNISEFKITPRMDQKPVLDYKSGRMAVSAVAGAGKTTIMLALIVKLLNQGTRAENIFVLTFMESAARNFKERIKQNCPNLVELPHISTIHGLALRILRENNNHAYLNLDDNFDIADETVRTKILGEILYNAGLTTDKTELYDRAISSYKNQTNVTTDYLKPLFRSVINEYQKTLLNLNMIDYDDLLAYSLKLLKTNRGVREYYQNLAEFIIEDEAQDSSAVQQELISILGAKHGNVIRCGDVNQAITTTFSNADTKGFKNFISKYTNITMDYSNRNATGIIKLANKTIKYALKKAPDSFLDIETKPVKGKNIVDSKAVENRAFENEKDEKKFVLEKLNEIFKNDPKASTAILLRSNKSVDFWASYIRENSKIKPITKNDNLSGNPVFKIVLAILNFINNPLHNKTVDETVKTLVESGFYENEYDIFSYLDKLTEPFILGNNESFSLWWDLRYFLSKAVLSPFELSHIIGEYYFANNLKEKANIPLTSAIVAKTYNVWGNFEDTISKLNDMANKPYRGNLKFFETDKEGIEETEAKKNQKVCSSIEIATMHKSKGAEYDYVFIPELTENNIGLDISIIKLKESTKFVESTKLHPKTEKELKSEITDENFRLIYVALTRARKKLFLSVSKEYKFYKRIKTENPCEIFEIIKSNEEGEK